MKNWKVIAALILFFPLGLYLMFKYTNWSNKAKWIITAFYSFITGATIISEFFYDLIFILAFVFTLASVVWFIYAIMRRKQKRTALLALIFGIVLTAYSGNIVTEQVAEADRIAQEEQQEQERIAEEEALEKERIAEEKRLEQERLAEQKEIEDRQEKYLSLATTAVKEAEEDPTRENVEKAKDLMDEIPTESKEELVVRIRDIEEIIEENDSLLEELESAIKIAEENKDRESFNIASSLSSSLLIENTEVISRLDELDEELTLIEEQKAQEEKLAREKAEAEQLAKEQAEAERIAKEKALAEEQAAKEKKASSAPKSNSSNSTSTSGSSNVSSTPVQKSTPSNDVSKVVYIAPDSGTKFHYSSSCRGLNNANSIAELSVDEAKAQGYTLCGWED